MTDAIQRLRGLAAGLCHESGIGLESSEDRWAFDPVKRVILVPKKALAELGPEGCAGVLAHEVGHVAISRYHLFAPGPPSPVAFNFLANCLEDARVEAWMGRRYPGVAGWLDKARDTDRLVESLPHQAHFVQYGLASRLSWSSTGEPSRACWELVAEPVRQVLEQTERACGSYVLDHLPSPVPGLLEGRLPDVLAYESEVLLIESDLADIPLTLWEKFIRVLAHRSHETLLKQILPKVLPLWSADVGRIGSLLSRRSDLRRLVNSPAVARSGLAAQIIQASQRESGDEQALTDPSRKGAVRVLNAFLETTTQAQESGVARAMREDLPRRPGHAERPRKVLRRRAESRKADAWLDAWRAVEGQARSLVRSLERLLQARRQNALRGSQTSGSRVDMRALLAAEADPRRSHRVWARRTGMSRQHETAFLLLVDLSGSMQGERVQAATRATVLLSEVLLKMKVPFSVMGFQDVLIPLVGFGEQLAQPSRERIAQMTDEVSGVREGGNNQPAYNDDGPCLREASETLLRRWERERVLVVISDGLPEGSRSDEGDLRSTIRWVEEKGIRLIGLGLGPRTDHVETFYRFGRGGIEVGALASVVGELVGKVLGA